MLEEITAACNNATQLLFSLPSGSHIRVVSHYDADGISAAGVICTALHRAGYEFHATLMRNPYTKGFDRLKKETNDLIIFSDMGSGQLQTITELRCPAIILDHHQLLSASTPKDIVQLNSNQFGADGNYEASGATMSFVFATALDTGNEDLAPLALAGATGDKQFIGGFRGLNQEILQNAVQKGFLSEQTGIKLSGDTITEALFFSIDPYYPGLSGNQEAIDAALQKLGVEKTATLSNLHSDDMSRLQSFLLFSLLKTHCQPSLLETVIRKRYIMTPQGWELERLADLIDACGKNGSRSLGLALCLGDPSAWNEAVSVEKNYKQKILNGLDKLSHGGIHETSAMRYFYTEDSSLGGVIAGIAANYLFDEKKPLISLVKKESDNEIHVSCRGNQMLVKHGLDLASAMKDTTAVLGGHGGGHKIAAGATITLEKEKEFLEKVDMIIQKQLKVSS